MTALPIKERQDRGCVFEERTGPVRAIVLKPSPPWRDAQGAPVPPSECPLYLGRVAESSDVWDALPAYRKGVAHLEAWLGRRPERALLDVLAAIEWGEGCWESDENGGARPRKGGA